MIDKSLLLNLRKSIYLNSKCLLFDAEILFREKSYSSSIFLSITAIEEAGKLYDTLIAFNKINELDQKKFYLRFTNHKLKHLSSFTKSLVDLRSKGGNKKVSKNISKLWGFTVDKVPFRNKGRQQPKLMGIRNDSIYTDVDFGNGSVLIPNGKKKEAYQFLEMAYEVLFSQIETAFGHFWIDESQDIDIKKIESEKALLTKRLQALKVIKK